MYQYQETNQYFGQIAGGSEIVGKQELASLGATEISEAYRGLYFKATPEVLYRLNYASRLFTRFLAPLLTFDCHSDRYLYNTALSINWEDFFSLEQTFAVFASVSNSKINHSKYAALKVKDAIVDQFRKKYNKRPNVARHNPDVWINIHIHNNKAVLSVDTSGGSLHRRGYRQEALQAPMQETVAATLLYLTDWQGNTPLYDPMCGSGTLLAEALMRSCNIPAGYLRKQFGFMHLPDFQPHLWEEIKEAAQHQMLPLPEGLIQGSDINQEALQACKTNLNILPFGTQVLLQKQDFNHITALENKTIVCNPPYGIRMGNTRKLEGFYKAFGDFLKQKCTSSTAYIYFGDRHFLKHIGLRPSWKKPLVSGNLDGRLAKFELY